uniref:Uncharacterized protein n=1 Tax=Rhinolophus ferrumequinum TaxID=59479 RepID=A0A671EWT9_RHIFE
MVPAGPLSGGPVLGHMTSAVLGGSIPKTHYTQDDRALSVLLGENTTKFICGKKIHSSQNFPPIKKKKKNPCHSFQRNILHLGLLHLAFHV